MEDPALSRIWTVLRERLEARGRCAEGRVVLTGLSRPERHAASALVGWPVTKDRLTIDLATLDTWLAERSGVGGLVAVVEVATGAPVVDRPALRAHRVAEREAPLELARTLLPEAPWREAWLDGVRRAGLLSRTSDPEQAVRVAATTLVRLPSSTSRTELATAVAGHAHALDEGTAAAALVLRALAARSGEPPPTTTAQRRDLWERFGVRVDQVSTTCLTLGLRGAARLNTAADAGDPIHLTAWDLRRCTPTPPVSVLVCENPRVLEAVAERFGGRLPVVCTSGSPALVVLDVLHGLACAELHYHGDFDWPGIAIANRLIAEVGVVPWQMGPDDYTTAVAPSGIPLTGTSVEPSWDPELGAAMRHHGVAVHEEAVLPTLLDRLGR
jgi:uncharacterized protein (TIGR02679 family)